MRVRQSMNRSIEHERSAHRTLHSSRLAKPYDIRRLMCNTRHLTLAVRTLDTRHSRLTFNTQHLALEHQHSMLDARTPMLEPRCWNARRSTLERLMLDTGTTMLDAQTPRRLALEHPTLRTPRSNTVPPMDDLVAMRSKT